MPDVQTFSIPARQFKDNHNMIFELPNQNTTSRTLQQIWNRTSSTQLRHYTQNHPRHRKGSHMQSVFKRQINDFIDEQKTIFMSYMQTNSTPFIYDPAPISA